MRRLPILFLALNLNFLVLSVINFIDEVNWRICLIAAAYGLTLVVLQLAMISVLEKFRFDRLSLLVCSFFSGTNFIAFYGSFFEKIMVLAPPVIFALGGAVSIIIGLCFFYAQRKPRLIPATILVVVAMAISSIFLEAGASIPRHLSAQATLALDKYRIRLRQRPNIHLLAFDSLMPKALVKKHLGLETPYADYLEAKEAFLVQNMFVGQSPSVPSLSDLLRLSDPTFLTGDRAQADFITGRLPGPVVALLSSNGYRIKIDYPDDVLGKKGGYIDEYRTPDETKIVSKSALCLTASLKEQWFLLYGFCRLFGDFGSRNMREKQSWRELVLRKMVEKNVSDQPSFTLQYIYMPVGHTWKSYDHASSIQLNKYRTHYDVQSKELTSYLKRVTEAITARDPDSIVLIFGDHGPYLSRGVDPKDDSQTHFHVLDRYGAFGALLKTQNVCSRVPERAYTSEFATPSRILAEIFRCLAMDPGQVDRAVNFREDFDLKKFRYE